MISITNELKAKAAHSYQQNDFITSSLLYDSLISHYKMNDEGLRLNLAHSYFKIENRKKAVEQYKILCNSEDPAISSIAFLQLGLLSAMKGKTDDAISYFKKSLKINEKNEKARYNLELIIKLKQLETDQNSKSSKQGTKGQEKGGGKKSGKGSGKQETSYNQISDNGTFSGNKGNNQQKGGLQEEGSGEGTEGESEGGQEENDTELKKDQKGNKEEESIKIKRLAEIKISQERARLILEEMRNEEVQYLQQLKKHQQNKDYDGKPDW